MWSFRPLNSCSWGGREAEGGRRVSESEAIHQSSHKRKPVNKTKENRLKIIFILFCFVCMGIASACLVPAVASRGQQIP